MIVIVIVGVLAGLAAPSFNSVMGSMSARSAAFELVSDLTLARSEAVKRNRSVSVVPVSGNWSNGWTIRDSGGTIASQSALSSSISIGAPSAGVVFLPSGRLNGVMTNAAWAVTSSVQGASARCVTVTPTGSARAKKGGC